MPKHEDIRVERFAQAYIDSGMGTAVAACRLAFPELPESQMAGLAYDLHHAEGCQRRIDELYQVWVAASIKRTAAKLQRAIDLPLSNENIDAKDLGRVADVQAKYLGVASRMANADGSNLPQLVICELPAQILDGPDNPRASAPEPLLGANGGSPEQEGGQP